MFDKDYAFHGTHAEKVIQLTAKIGDTGKSLFDRNLDVYLIAPVVGRLYGRTAERNTKGGKTTNILLGALSSETSKLEMNYRTIMLLDEEGTKNLQDRLDKVFKITNEDRDKRDIDRYESFVLGGVDILHEKLIEPAKTPSDYFRLLDDFLNDFNTRYDDKLTDTEEAFILS